MPLKASLLMQQKEEEFKSILFVVRIAIKVKLPTKRSMLHINAKCLSNFLELCSTYIPNIRKIYCTLLHTPNRPIFFPVWSTLLQSIIGIRELIKLAFYCLYYRTDAPHVYCYTLLSSKHFRRFELLPNAQNIIAIIFCKN